MREKSVRLLFAFLVSIVVVTNAVPKHWASSSYANNITAQSHNLIVGARLPGDRLVCKEHAFKSSMPFIQINLQRTFNVSKYERITQIRAIDQKTNGKGASARLIGGGPGLSCATLRFQSQRGHGINFVVELYARP